MSQVKFNFINWRPDAEDMGNDGLVTADNVLHQPEGYIEYRTPTAAGFYATTATC